MNKKERSKVERRLIFLVQNTIYKLWIETGMATGHVGLLWLFAIVLGPCLCLLMLSTSNVGMHVLFFKVCHLFHELN